MAGVVGFRLAVTAGAAVGVAGPGAVVLTHEGSPQAAGLTTPYAYVANAAPGTVSVISTSTNTAVKTVKVGRGPNDVAITPNGNRATPGQFHVPFDQLVRHVGKYDRVMV